MGFIVTHNYEIIDTNTPHGEISQVSRKTILRYDDYDEMEKFVNVILNNVKKDYDSEYSIIKIIKIDEFHWKTSVEYLDEDYAEFDRDAYESMELPSDQHTIEVEPF